MGDGGKKHRFINILVTAIDQSCQETTKVSANDLQILKYSQFSCGLVTAMSDTGDNFRNVL